MRETPIELVWRLIREGYSYQEATRRQLLAEAERNRTIIARGGQP